MSEQLRERFLNRAKLNGNNRGGGVVNTSDDSSIMTLSEISDLRDERLDLYNQATEYHQKNSKKWNATNDREWSAIQERYNSVVSRLEAGEADLHERTVNQQINSVGGNAHLVLADGRKAKLHNSGESFSKDRAFSNSGTPFEGRGGDVDFGGESRETMDDFCYEFVNYLSGKPHSQNVLKSVGTDGALLPSMVVNGQFWKHIFKASAVLGSGVPTFVMPSPKVRVMKVNGRFPTQHVAETGEILGHDVGFSATELHARKIGEIFFWSSEAEEDMPNAVSALRTNLVESVAAAVDANFLSGSGQDGESTGLLNQSGIQSQPIGGEMDWDDVIGAVGKIKRADYPRETSSLNWIRHSALAEDLAKLKDSQGRYLAAPPFVADLMTRESTRLPFTEGDPDTTDSLIFDPQSCLIGIRRELQIEVFTSGTVKDSSGKEYNLLSQDLKAIRATWRGDIAVIRPEFLCTMTGAEL